MKKYIIKHGVNKNGVDNFIKGLKIFGKLMVAIIIIAIITMIAIMLLMSSNKISLFTGTDKEKFISELEKKYNIKLEIVNDTTVSRRGTGTYILKTKEEPIIKFHAEKDLAGSYKADFEENIIKYYYENEEYENLFSNIDFISENVESYNTPGFYFLNCKLYYNANNYSEIEKATKQIYNLLSMIRAKIKTFNIIPKIKIENYESSVYYPVEYSENQMIYEEEYNYYWYLKNNNMDMSEIPAKDVEKLNFPGELNLSVDGKELRDTYNKNLTVEYDKLLREYKIRVADVVANTEKVELLNNNFNSDLKFKYESNEYEIHYFDNKIYGKKLPAYITISELENIFNVTVNYDYDNKKIEINFN